MITRLLISPSLQARQEKIKEILSEMGLTLNHPDLFYFEKGTKLGIKEARKIKEHFFTKPFQGRGKMVVLEDAGALSEEAQNALLKIIEEPPLNGLLLLGADSRDDVLPTIISRCQLIFLDSVTKPDEKLQKDIAKLSQSDMPERFNYIEKLDKKGEFLKALISYFHQKLLVEPNKQSGDFLEELIRAEKWFNQNVNQRGILEYLMLKMPKK